MNYFRSVVAYSLPIHTNKYVCVYIFSELSATDKNVINLLQYESTQYEYRNQVLNTYHSLCIHSIAVETARAVSPRRICLCFDFHLTCLCYMVRFIYLFTLFVIICTVLISFIFVFLCCGSVLLLFLFPECELRQLFYFLLR